MAMVHRRVWIYTMCFLWLFTCKVSAQGSSQEKEIRKMLALLGQNDAYKRTWAVQRLLLLGNVVPYLKQALPKSNYIAKKHIVYIFGRMTDEDSLYVLFRMLWDKSEEVQTEAAIALLNRSDTEPEIVDRLYALYKKHAGRNAVLEELIDTLQYKAVEDYLSSLVNNNGCYGFHSAQFVKLKRRGNEIVMPLVEIFSLDEYRYIHNEMNTDPRKRYNMRLMAGQALGEVGSIFSGAQRAIVCNTLRRMSLHRDRELQKVAACSLAKLGDRTYFYRKVDRCKDRIRINPKDAMAHYELGMLYLRIQSIPRAIKYLERSASLNPGNNLASYNLACIYAGKNQLDKSLITMRKAIDHGFDDIEWIKRDHSLNNLHTHPQFYILLKHLTDKLETSN